MESNTFGCWLSTTYMYVVTRASEEAIELLGYTFNLLGSIDYFFFLKSKKREKAKIWEQLTDLPNGFRARN